MENKDEHEHEGQHIQLTGKAVTSGRTGQSGQPEPAPEPLEPWPKRICTLLMRIRTAVYACEEIEEKKLPDQTAAQLLEHMYASLLELQAVMNEVSQPQIMIAVNTYKLDLFFLKPDRRDAVHKIFAAKLKLEEGSGHSE